MRIRKKIGLYYNRFRYYDPSLGQYTQQDPIGLAGGNPTLYGYVFNTMWELDPFGLDWKDLLETGLGHHLFPRSVAKKLGIEEWAKLTAYSWYPYETAGSGHFAWRIVSQSENVVDIRKTCYGIYSV